MSSAAASALVLFLKTGSTIACFIALATLCIASFCASSDACLLSWTSFVSSVVGGGGALVSLATGAGVLSLRFAKTSSIVLVMHCNCVVEKVTPFERRWRNRHWDSQRLRRSFRLCFGLGQPK